MKTASALTLAAVGAILAFAVTAQPSFFSFHIAGWVLMITGLAGAVIPRRGYGWLRRRLVLTTPGGRRQELDLRPRRYSRLLVPGGLITGQRVPARGARVESSTIETGAGTVDTGTVDTGTVDTGTVVTGTVETGTVESDVIEQYLEDYEE
jgi:hypothetical protein